MQRNSWHYPFPALILCAILVWLVQPGDGRADEIGFRATLNAFQEVPPAESPGEGMADVTLDTDARKLSWTITYHNLVGEVTGVHFHGPAREGMNAESVVNAGDDGFYSPITGEATLTEEQVRQLMAGQWYINLRTDTWPRGEIRGQLKSESF